MIKSKTIVDKIFSCVLPLSFTLVTIGIHAITGASSTTIGTVGITRFAFTPISMLSINIKLNAINSK